jgi:hypothetical protein
VWSYKKNKFVAKLLSATVVEKLKHFTYQMHCSCCLAMDYCATAACQWQILMHYLSHMHFLTPVLHQDDILLHFICDPLNVIESTECSELCFRSSQAACEALQQFTDDSAFSWFTPINCILELHLWIASGSLTLNTIAWNK